LKTLNHTIFLEIKTTLLPMKNNLKVVEQIYQNVATAKSMGISQNIIQDSKLTDRKITLHNNQCINFASCSYLGIEKDPRLVEAAVDATRKFGTQFSASRAYLSVSLYHELEDLLSKLFGYPTIVSATTTLGHMSAIPVLIDREDAIIIDQQVHASVQTAVKLVQATGTYVETVRHNRMDYLEARIKKLQNKHRKIWYMADGVYSMYGDAAPMKDLHYLMEKYNNFHLYIDDAHGMSWLGKNGVGYVLDQGPLHKKTVMLTSLNKSFSAAGGAIICSDPEVEKMIRYCGGTLMFSGPVQPPQLGAAIASAKIHLSGEIEKYQQDLQDNMALFLDLIREFNLPLLGEGKTPIFYIGIGKVLNGYHMVQRLMQRGFFTSIGAFPSVPMNRSGVRVTINANHTQEQIRNLANTIREELDILLDNENMSMNDLYKFLKIDNPATPVAV
jgi:7-keto-8-aminopelargonate synthetase-like enzyme